MKIRRNLTQEISKKKVNLNRELTSVKILRFLLFYSWKRNKSGVVFDPYNGNVFYIRNTVTNQSQRIKYLKFMSEGRK